METEKWKMENDRYAFNRAEELTEHNISVY
jgi:hypothetical protein